MSTPKNPPVDAHLCFALYSASLNMTQRYKPLLEELGVTYPQYLVLLVLWNQQHLGIKDIAERLHQDPGSITPIVKRLEVQGYVKRRRDVEDERNVIVSLTEVGENLRDTACGIHDAIASICGMPNEKTKELVTELLALRGNLEST
jgi:DNA-binding MarR family transcriptional regulator